MVGAGKYDDVATRAREETAAAAVLLCIVGGAKGSGFSVQADSRDVMATLPEVLRRVADAIDEDLRRV